MRVNTRKLSEGNHVSFLDRKHQTKVHIALITPTIAITLIPTIASTLPTRLTEPLLLVFDVDEDVAGAEGVKTAAAFARHELATAVAETVGVTLLTVPFPPKLHAWGFLLLAS